MIIQIDYRTKNYYVRELTNLKSCENKTGRGILIGHPQMGEIEIPECVAVQLFANYLLKYKERNGQSGNPTSQT